MCLYITENIEARILYIRGLGYTAIGHYAPYAVAVAKARCPLPARHGLGRSGAMAQHISQVGPDAKDGEERTDETGRGGPVCGETDSGSLAA